MAALGAVALAPDVARADVGAELAFGAGVLVTSLPSPTAASLTTSRTIPGDARIPTGGRYVGMLGAHVDAVLALDRHTILPLFGAAGYGAVGSFDTIVTSVDGSIARVHPWTSARLDLLLPGFGLRGVHRRFAGSAVLRSGIGGAWVGGELAEGTEAVPFSSARITPLLQLEVEACRRLDPAQRLCLVAAPRLHDFGWLTGLGVALRWEVGR